jgi:hypothetical protein
VLIQYKCAYLSQREDREEEPLPPLVHLDLGTYSRGPRLARLLGIAQGTCIGGSEQVDGGGTGRDGLVRDIAHHGRRFDGVRLRVHAVVGVHNRGRR